MARLKPSSLKEIVKKARRERANNKSIQSDRIRQGYENSSRRVSIWKMLYAAALNGETSVSIPNLFSDDIKYFEEQNLALKVEYARKKSVEEINYLIDKKEQAIERFDDFEFELKLALDPINEWLLENANVVFEADLDHWFIEDDFDFHFEIEQKEQLQTFLKEIKSTISITKDADRKAGLKALSKLIINAIVKLNSGNKDVVLVEKSKKLEKLEQEVIELKLQEDYLQKPGIQTIHLCDWLEPAEEPSEKTGEFSFAGLSWLSSSAGQRTLANLESNIVVQAKSGRRSITIKCSAPGNDATPVNASITTRESWFHGQFPSLFDFEMAIQLLGYEIKKRVTKNTINLVISW